MGYMPIPFQRKLMGNSVVYEDANGIHGLTPQQVRDNFDNNIPTFFFKLFSGTKRCYALMNYLPVTADGEVSYYKYQYGTASGNTLYYSVPGSNEVFTATQPS